MRLSPATRFLFGLALALPLACSDPGPNATHRAVAELDPTEGHQASGTVRFEAREQGGLRVVASLAGLEAGEHAFHVHQVGDCSEDAQAAGAHFDFLGGTSGHTDRIQGNLGELRADADGEARIEARIGHARLEGPRGIVGKAVVVHARGNDPDSPPDGAAGKRIACGVIEAAEDRVASAGAEH